MTSVPLVQRMLRDVRETRLCCVSVLPISLLLRSPAVATEAVPICFLTERPLAIHEENLILLCTVVFKIYLSE